MALNVNGGLNLTTGSIEKTSLDYSYMHALWSSGLNFDVKADNINIGTIIYNAPETTISLDTADSTHDRIDLIILSSSLDGDINATITKITGVPSANPQYPTYDIDTQVAIKYVKVKANATTPTIAGTSAIDIQSTDVDFEQDTIYLNNEGPNNEWTTHIGIPYYDKDDAGNFIQRLFYDSSDYAKVGTFSIKKELFNVNLIAKRPGAAGKDPSSRHQNARFSYAYNAGNRYRWRDFAGLTFWYYIPHGVQDLDPRIQIEILGFDPSTKQTYKKQLGKHFKNNAISDGNHLHWMNAYRDFNPNITGEWRRVVLSKNQFNPVGDKDPDIFVEAVIINPYTNNFSPGISNQYIYLDQIILHMGSVEVDDIDTGGDNGNNNNNTGNTGNNGGSSPYKYDEPLAIVPNKGTFCVNGFFSSIGGGNNNIITSSKYSYIGAGQNNTIESGSDYSSILGGSNNTTSYENSFIIGSNLTSNKACYTFMNNLDVEGTASATIFSGSFVGDGRNLTGISGSGSTNTGSLVTSASISSTGSGNTITFTKGDNSTFDITVNTGSDGSSTNTGSLVTSASISSTGSGNTITFTKGDNSTFDITVNTGSGSGGGNSITVQDNGTPLTTDLSLLNFVGATVTETTEDNVTVTIGSGLYELGGTNTSLQPVFNNNCVYSADSAIGSGFENSISGSGNDNSGSYIGSGYQNQITGSGFNRHFIGTGFQNQIKNGQNNFIGAGVSNIINASVGVIFGANNTIQGADGDYASSFSTILGGDYNTIQSDYNANYKSETIINGLESLIDANGYNLIGNGKFHQITGSISGSAILGGAYNKIEHSNSFIIGSDITSSAECTTFMNNLDVEGTVSASIFSGSFVGDGSGLTGIGGGGSSITVQDNGSSCTTALSLLNFVGATVTEPTEDNVTVTIGAGLLEVGEGTDTFKDVIGDHIVAAPSSSIVGGIKNTIACTSADPNFGSFYNFIGGGFCNLISGSSYSTIIGSSRGLLTTGSESTTVSPFDVIVGGQENIAGGGFSSVIGGGCNVAIGCSSTAVGGVGNKALGKRSSILGGSNNTVISHAGCSGYSTIIGSRCSTVDTCYNNNTSIGEVIVGGSSNKITGSACLGAVLGGAGHTVCHKRSAIVGGNSITTQADNTTYVENLHVTSSFDQANYLSSILTLSRKETTPDSPLEGMIMASGSAGSSKLYYYDGSSWNALF